MTTTPAANGETTTVAAKQERHQHCGHIQKCVFDLVEAWVLTVDCFFFDILEHRSFFLPQSSIPALALGLHAHMDEF
jgi:hypothetical protein